VGTIIYVLCEDSSARQLSKSVEELARMREEGASKTIEDLQGKKIELETKIANEKHEADDLAIKNARLSDESINKLCSKYSEFKAEYISVRTQIKEKFTSEYEYLNTFMETDSK
jgi:uncharacterized protein involved in exopolysaccharide biosynthesis